MYSRQSTVRFSSILCVCDSAKNKSLIDQTELQNVQVGDEHLSCIFIIYLLSFTHIFVCEIKTVPNQNNTFACKIFPTLYSLLRTYVTQTADPFFYCEWCRTGPNCHVVYVENVNECTNHISCIFAVVTPCPHDCIWLVFVLNIENQKKNMNKSLRRM